MRHETPVDVLILAAGDSSRMGQPKAFLPFPDKPGEDFLGQLTSVYESEGIHVAVVLPASIQRSLPPRVGASPLPRTVVYNDRQDLGRIHSVRTGLAAARPRGWVIIQDVDRPFVTRELIVALMRARGRGVTIPTYNGERGHPVLLSPEVAQVVLLDRRPTTLREALASFPHKMVAWKDVKCGMNVNTPEELNDVLPTTPPVEP
jgi:molybdenum cofactor cytidylyltransferase